MVNTAGPHSPMPLPPSTPIALIAMSVALVTSATSAMRPWKEIAALRSWSMRASSAMTIGAIAATAEREEELRRRRRAERVGHAVVHEHRRETFDDPFGEQREPTFDRRGFRTHEEGRELGDDEHRARRPPPNPDAPARP